MSDAGFSTRAIHGAQFHSAEPGDPISFPLFQTSSFSFADTAAISEMQETGRGFAYSRAANPTVAAFEQVMANLEGAEAACAFASGMAAIHAAIISCVAAGEHIVATRDVYGGTYHLLTDILPKFGISHTFVDMTDLTVVRAAIRPETRLLWGETISNPTTVVLDLPSLGAIAHERGLLFAVDATFTTPYLSLPLTQGADLVAHSATKYLGGHGDLIAGVVAGNGELMGKVRQMMTGAGGNMAPLEAFLLLRGLKTLEIRIDRHCLNARRVAEALAAHPLVTRVYYPGLPDHPQYAIASRLLRDCGGFLSFTVQGDLATARAVLDHLKLVKRAASLGDAHSLASLPVMTSHHLLAPADRAAFGISDTMIRAPIGLENSADIIADFMQALDAVAAPSNGQIYAAVTPATSVPSNALLDDTTASALLLSFSDPPLISAVAPSPMVPIGNGSAPPSLPSATAVADDKHAPMDASRQTPTEIPARSRRWFGGRRKER